MANSNIGRGVESTGEDSLRFTLFNADTNENFVIDGTLRDLKQVFQYILVNLS